MSKNTVKHFYPRISAEGTCNVVEIVYEENGNVVWLDGVYRAIGNGCDMVEPVYCSSLDGVEYAVLVDEEGLLRKGATRNEKLSEALRQLAVKKAGMTYQEAVARVPQFYGTGLFAMLDETVDEFVGWTSEEEAKAFLSELVS